nr:polysaccharide deacetylase family protein [Clostridium butyricum]
MRIMMFLVMTIFVFNGALNKAYANDYELNTIGNTNSNNETSRDDIGEESTSENNNSNQNEIKSSKGVNKEGEEYSYDAVKINDKLKKGDYSNGGEKIVFLTFDDGTSTTVTPKVLKILDQYNIKATFFLMGKNIDNGGEAAKELVKEEYNSGHAIGNHSYSHDYNILYPGRTLNLESFKEDFNKNTKLLKAILGDDFSTRVIRCPGGYMSWKGMNQLDGYLNDNNMTYIDWNALSKDAEGKKKNADELFQNAVDTSKNKEIVVLLMHDTYGKEETAKSLPKIIEYFKNSGYEFKTLA